MLLRYDNLFGSQRAVAMWISSVIFFASFFSYFSILANREGITIPTIAGSGNLTVTFTEEDVVVFEDSETLLDGDVVEFTHIFDDNDIMLGYVELVISHDETDEGGPNPGIQEQCDKVYAEMKMENVDGFVVDGSNTSGESEESCPSEFTMRILLTENYSGDAYQVVGDASDVLALWVDEGKGRGEWNCEIELETRTGSSPGPSPGGPILNNNEDGEEITISWRFVAYTVDIEVES